MERLTVRKDNPRSTGAQKAAREGRPASRPDAGRPDEHSELLTRARDDKERAKVALGLQQTYGNAYVQRLVSGAVVQRQEAAPGTEAAGEIDFRLESQKRMWQRLVIKPLQEAQEAALSDPPDYDGAGVALYDAYGAITDMSTTMELPPGVADTMSVAQEKIVNLMTSVEAARQPGETFGWLFEGIITGWASPEFVWG